MRNPYARLLSFWASQFQDKPLVPGIVLDFIGRMESFNTDFSRVLDRLGASDEIRREALVSVNPSHHDHWSDYYTSELADRVYQAYECDFDRFGYPRALPGSQPAAAVRVKSTWP